MKAKRRHELQHNVLDAELGKVLGFFKRHGSRLVTGVLVVLAVVLVAMRLRSCSREKSLALQQRYDDLVLRADPEMQPDDRLARLKELAGQDDDRRIAAMACVAVAETYAARAILSPSAAERAAFVSDAEEYCRKTVEQFADQPLCVAKARIGLAKLAEGRRDFAAAREQYTAVKAMTDLAGTPVLDLAEVSLAELVRLEAPVRMATTTSAPASGPATGPATATAPASSPGR